MSDSHVTVSGSVREQMLQDASFSEDLPIRLPLYRRDIFPTNLVLSAGDLRDFCELLVEVNERAKDIEYRSLDLSTFGSPEDARTRLNELMPIEYSYKATNGDSVQGLGVPRTDERTFPDNLRSLFASNAAYADRAIDRKPMNTVEAFLSFDKPTLKIDVQTFPSNPTENRSVINVGGRDEDWVISTAQKIENFLNLRKAARPVIHGSGAYDYIIYFVFLPVVFWSFHRYAASVSVWIEQQTVFLNVILGIYGLLLSLLLARFLFQYARWLFPPMEYYKRSRVGAFFHRAVASTIGIGVIASASYDLLWTIIKSFVE